jgi:hypothetical protein
VRAVIQTIHYKGCTSRNVMDAPDACN